MIEKLYTDKKGRFEIIKRECKPDSLPDWKCEEYSILCKELIKNSEARGLFLTSYLGNNPPLLFSDPSYLFNEKLALSRSGFFDSQTIMIFKENDSIEKEKLMELAKKLIEHGYLKKDIFSIIKCNDCKSFSIGGGDTNGKKGFYCTKCGKPGYQKKSPGHRVINAYCFSPLLQDLLFKWPGRILEGIIYHQCCLDVKINQRFNIESYIRIREKEGESEERDIILIDKENTIPPIVILASLSSSGQNEKRQVGRCYGLGLPVIFVCARGISEPSRITTESIKLFSNVISDNNFPISLTEYIVKQFLK